LKRKDFIQLASTSATALMMHPFAGTAPAPKPAFSMNKNFELKILATNWGFAGTIDAFCAAAKKEGYDGAEIWWPGDKKAQDELFAAMKKYSLELGIILGASQSDWKEHLETFKKITTEAAKNTSQRPLYINCHSGRDHFGFEQNKLFIEHTTALAKETGILICHETHRSRIMYSAPVARQYMEKFEALKLTFDVSHWCNVHESLLEDQPETLAMTLERTEHIHARIGHAEGPQVNDPRAPEWENVVKKHFEWWDKIAERKKKNGERLTILTEFGPPDYMPTLPYTRQAVADQWAINVYMLQLLRKRYA
jgi:sugar phosphate isomerase/epimerase